MRPLATIEMAHPSRSGMVRCVICLDGHCVVVLDPLGSEPRRECGVENIDQAIDYIEVSWGHECWDLQWLVDDLEELEEVLP